MLDFNVHHAEMRQLLRSHELVTPSLFSRIDERLTYWRENHTGTREKMLWFCVNRQLVFDDGTESLFKYFGGEAVYSAFSHDPEIESILERLGDPVVVEVLISSRELKVFQEFAFARTLISHFAKSVNPEFRVEDREGYMSKGVEPGEIVAIHCLKDFMDKYHRKRLEKGSRNR